MNLNLQALKPAGLHRNLAYYILQLLLADAFHAGIRDIWHLPWWSYIPQSQAVEKLLPTKRPDMAESLTMAGTTYLSGIKIYKSYNIDWFF